MFNWKIMDALFAPSFRQKANDRWQRYTKAIRDTGILSLLPFALCRLPGIQKPVLSFSYGE
jgi:hypothetical protein